VTVAEQAALDLAGTKVAVTLLCPALIRSAMSPDGADPGDVAAAALDAADRGVFAVIPPEWAQSVRDRSRRLSVGLPPQLPVAS
jgi:short-subunit dehydrogenase